MNQREWVEKDYYAILGVDKSASEAQIRKAYRKLAQKHHPDANQGDPKAEERFKEISQANDVIGDPVKRREYDQVRAAFGSGTRFQGFGGGQRVNVEDVFGSGAGGFEDLFGSLFGGSRGPQKGPDLETQATLGFEEALDGTTVTLNLSDGAESRTIKARIPAGVNDGARIRLPGKGGASPYGGPRGDLFIRVAVTPHRFFGRKGKDLTLQLPVTFVEATLGAEVEVPTLNGHAVLLKVPVGTSSGKTFRVRGKGPAGAPDILVTLQVAVPKRLSKDQKELLRRFAELEGESPRESFEEPR
ncbi:MAG TPA: DnaJ C-terminal domain-containing protein [Actinomycetota bacterium]|nr:DnaJ C-terminal domain-containing protein [Actinomycetota bacterium]